MKCFILLMMLGSNDPTIINNSTHDIHESAGMSEFKVKSALTTNCIRR
ncbi:MAG: hypothetical protein ACRC6V_06600 [Bacteroidales bacterium]